MSALIFVALCLVALLLWFIWKQLERIANELCALHRIARERSGRA